MKKCFFFLPSCLLWKEIDVNNHIERRRFSFIFIRVSVGSAMSDNRVKSRIDRFIRSHRCKKRKRKVVDSVLGYKIVNYLWYPSKTCYTFIGFITILLVCRVFLYCYRKRRDRWIYKLNMLIIYTKDFTKYSQLWKPNGTNHLCISGLTYFLVIRPILQD